MKKKRLRYSRKRIFIGLFLFLFLVGIGLGYALVTTKLEIDGIVHVKDARWNVHFDNFQEITGSVDPISNPTVSGTSINFSAMVTNPGDFYGFTIDVENEGTIDASINSFSLTPDFANVDYIDATVEYDNGSPVSDGNILLSGTTKTIKVILSYKEGIDASLYPTTDQSYNVILTLNYEQHIGDIPAAFNVGEYFTMVPDATSYDVLTTDTGYSTKQRITPNELTLWRVIKVNNDGSVEAVSHYVSSDTVTLESTTGYANYVAALQEIAEQYSKAGYTQSTRMFGYGGQTLRIPSRPQGCTTEECNTTTSYVFDGSISSCPLGQTTPSPTTGTGQEYYKGVGGDNLYLNDYQLVSSVYSDQATEYITPLMASIANTDISCEETYNPKTETMETHCYGENYFMASRYDDESLLCAYSARLINAVGELSYARMREYFNGRWWDGTVTTHIRPIITLKPGIDNVSGNGTKSNPYVLR